MNAEREALMNLSVREFLNRIYGDMPSMARSVELVLSAIVEKDRRQPPSTCLFHQRLAQLTSGDCRHDA